MKMPLHKVEAFLLFAGTNLRKRYGSVGNKKTRAASSRQRVPAMVKQSFAVAEFTHVGASLQLVPSLSGNINLK
jgi:hypothetical protein